MLSHFKSSREKNPCNLYLLATYKEKYFLQSPTSEVITISDSVCLSCSLFMSSLVSIITPSYNSSRFIAETIESVLAQTYQNWEMLITDDCSKDDSVEIIQRYAEKDFRIKLFQLEKNSGAGICRNNSIREAKGRYIAFLDSDDRWYPTKLEKQIAFMEQQGYAVSYTSYDVCDENGKLTGVVYCRKSVSYFSMLVDCGIGCLTGIYDTEVLGKVYMPQIRKRQDWALWIQLLKICRNAYGLKESLAIYRKSNSSISSNKFKLVSYNWAVYRKVLNFSLIKSFIYFYLLFIPFYFLKKVKIYFDSKKYIKA